MFILKNNPSLRRMRLMRRDFETTCTLKAIAVRRSLSVRSCFGAWCTNSYTSEKTTSNGEFIRTATRATKSLVATHYTQALGRSMVEMLGVLAIIGVLSVGAIAGYSKAMMKYKLNKHTEQMNTVINAVARNVHSFDNLSANGTPNVITSIFIKMGEIPTEMVKSTNTSTIYDIFGQSWQIFIGSDGSNLFLASWLVDGSSFLSSKSSDSLAICQNILTTAKENSESIFVITATTTNSDSSFEGDDATAHRLYGDKYCSADRTCLKNLTLDDIYTVCSKHIKNSKAAFQFLWSRR